MTPYFVYFALFFEDTTAANDLTIRYRLFLASSCYFQTSFQHIYVKQLLLSNWNSWVLQEQHVQFISTNCIHKRISFSPTLCHIDFTGNIKYFLALTPANKTTDAQREFSGVRKQLSECASEKITVYCFHNLKLVLYFYIRLELVMQILKPTYITCRLLKNFGDKF